jgi:hypothetical protein
MTIRNSATYAPRPGTITPEGARTISKYLLEPARLTRSLRTLTQQNFVADRILRGRVTTASGMVEYETTESIYPVGGAEVIEPGAEYPLVAIGDGETVLEAVAKNGLRTEITLEAVMRRVDEPIVRAQRKLANGVVLRFDTQFMGRLNSAKAQMNSVVGASWTGAGTTILRQLETAKAAILDRREGYNPTAVLLDRQKYAVLVSDEKVQNSLDRVSIDTEAFKGLITRVADLEIIVANTGTAFAADPVVFDPDMLGSVVSQANAEQRQNGDNGVYADVAWYGAANATGGAEFWSGAGGAPALAAGREALAIIQEPKSAAVITGTA